MNIFAILEGENAELVWEKLKNLFPHKSESVLLSIWREKFEEMRSAGNPFAQVYLDYANSVEEKSRQNVRGFMDMLKSHGVV